jgi:Rieske Fe-S protein
LKNNKHNRRYFIKSAGLGMLLAIGFLWDKLVKTENRLSGRKTINIPFNPNKNINFQDDFIVVNSDGQTKVFSSYCTHLGCKINKAENGFIICPCHGSAFNIEGDAVKGPAIHPLKSLHFSIDETKSQITVEV